MQQTSEIKKVVTKLKFKDKKTDAVYWRKQPFVARLAALEEIRQEYHRWRYGAEPGFQRVYSIVNANDVRYLVVGGYAVALHGYPRYTKDMDVWVEMTTENALRIVKALDQFGFGSLDLKESDFTEPDQIIQLGYPPRRIDILTTLPGVEFSECFPSHIVVNVEGV